MEFFKYVFLNRQENGDYYSSTENHLKKSNSSIEVLILN
jgi:hypothetical protein